jgi:hypothetical protein
MLSGMSHGRNGEGNASITIKVDLLSRFKHIMTSYLSFRAVGPSLIRVDLDREA